MEYRLILGNFTHVGGNTSSAVEQKHPTNAVNMLLLNLTTHVNPDVEKRPGVTHGQRACVSDAGSHVACPAYETCDVFKFQISSAYSLIVRSLENLPEHATLNIAFRDQIAESE